MKILILTPIDERSVATDATLMKEIMQGLDKKIDVWALNMYRRNASY